MTKRHGCRRAGSRTYSEEISAVIPSDSLSQKKLVMVERGQTADTLKGGVNGFTVGLIIKQRVEEEIPRGI